MEGKTGYFWLKVPPFFSLKRIKIFFGGDIGVILIIIYYIYNNLICVGWVAHFLCYKCFFVTMLSKCILSNAYHAHLRQDSRRIRHLRRTRAKNYPINETLSKSPLKPIKGSLKGRYSPDGSGLKIRPPVIIGNTLPTNHRKM